MQSLDDNRPSPGQPTVRDNRIDDLAFRTQLSVNAIEEHRELLPQVPDDGFSVCAACSAINFFDLQSEAGHIHSESFYAILASAMQGCPLCICLLPGLHPQLPYRGISDADMPYLNPMLRGMSIRLRSTVDMDSGETRSLIWLFEGPDAIIMTARFTVFALPGTAAARAGFGVHLPYSEEQKWSAMKSWLKRQTADAPINAPPPTRLIDVGNTPDAGIRLVETDTLSTGDQRYTALSYRWGDTNTLLTTRDTIRDLMADIPPETMPKTIRDAVTVTRRLGLRYLWVDCLCIIQGDPDDWKREAARMGDVYMNAHLTISTHAAKHANDGFLAESLQRERVYACGGHPDGGSFEDEMTAYNKFVESNGSSTDPPFASDAFFTYKGSHANHDLDCSELSSRGWVLQERILSPRLIHFGPGGSLYFESKDGVEHVETGLEPDDRRRFPSALKRLDQRETSPAPPDVVKDLYTNWYDIVMRYSACSLTKQEDKLVAIQGIARKFQELTSDLLTDGIWRNTSGFCLLWLSQEELLERNTSMQISSWSWASVEGKIQFPDRHITSLKGWDIIPEIDLVGIETSPTQKSVLRLDKVDCINAHHLRFEKGRVGHLKFDLTLTVPLTHRTRYWDVHTDDGQYLGWASLDHETRQTVDGLAAGITCIKIASSRDDVFDVRRGAGRGFLVLFIAFSPELGAWQRRGMGQIFYQRFQSEAVGMRLV